MDVRIGMCIHMSIDLCVDIHVAAEQRDKRNDCVLCVHRHVCVDMCADICAGMCADMSAGVQTCR